MLTIQVFPACKAIRDIELITNENIFVIDERTIITEEHKVVKHSHAVYSNGYSLLCVFCIQYLEYFSLESSEY